MIKEASLVRRIIAFLKNPGAVEADRRNTVSNPYDDFDTATTHRRAVHAGDQRDGVDRGMAHAATAAVLENPTPTHNYHRASRLDAVIMRALQQFHAHDGFVLRYDQSGQIHYCTGRDLTGRYIPHTAARADRRAVFATLDSGEAQLFVHNGQNGPVTVLCGPLRDGNTIIGVLYLYSPVRSRVHRGIFDIFCSQVARLLNAGVA